MTVKVTKWVLLTEQKGFTRNLQETMSIGYSSLVPLNKSYNLQQFVCRTSVLRLRHTPKFSVEHLDSKSRLYVITQKLGLSRSNERQRWGLRCQW